MVSFAGKQYRFGLEVTVNGRKKQQDYEIQPLDEIVTGGVLTLGDLLNSIGVEYAENFAINGEYAGEGDLLCDGDVITIKLAAAAQATAQATTQSTAQAVAQTAAQATPQTTAPAAPQAIAPAAVAEAEAYTPYPAETSAPAEEYRPAEEVYTPAAAAADPEPEPAAEPDLSLIVPELTVTLNDRPLTLPQKNDGEPHMFLELMNYADIDTENPQGTILEITLNGVDVSFGEELHSGDVAIVRWRN